MAQPVRISSDKLVDIDSTELSQVSNLRQPIVDVIHLVERL